MTVVHACAILALGDRRRLLEDHQALQQLAGEVRTGDVLLADFVCP
jgi:hypothetical protein